MSANNLLTALAEDNQTEITRLIPLQEFTLIEIADESAAEGSETEEMSALTAEIDDYLALVAFTSKEHVEQFAAKASDVLQNESDAAFTMSGTQMMELLPDDFGILFNPESSECFAMSPPVVEQMRESRNES